ncbi:MAG: hypothetical protein IKA00_04365 [Prevotella sp.]|nr:hypothetical protein [Bacteroidales bacterium]MBR2016522.1 hypothetical protein [Prevotella sp.]
MKLFRIIRRLFHLYPKGGIVSKNATGGHLSKKEMQELSELRKKAEKTQNYFDNIPVFNEDFKRMAGLYKQN